MLEYGVVGQLGALSLPVRGKRKRYHVTENKNGTCNGYISASSSFNWLATKPEAKKKKKRKRKDEAIRTHMLLFL